jgi:hypothetical protein
MALIQLLEANRSRLKGFDGGLELASSAVAAAAATPASRRPLAELNPLHGGARAAVAEGSSKEQPPPCRPHGPPLSAVRTVRWVRQRAHRLVPPHVCQDGNQFARAAWSVAGAARIGVNLDEGV